MGVVANRTSTAGAERTSNFYKRFVRKDGDVWHWVVRVATGAEGEPDGFYKPVVVEEIVPSQFLFRPWKKGWELSSA